MFVIDNSQHSEALADLQSASDVLNDSNNVPGHTQAEALAKAKAAVDRQIGVLSDLTQQPE